MKKRLIAAVVAVTGLVALYSGNASWRAEPSQGRPLVIAQRGVHQVFDLGDVDAATCTARRIPPPTHDLIENTIPSIAAAFRSGADVVEVDVRKTADGELVLFHDADLGCRTQGSGRIYKQTLATLKTLDVGYGYTADGGRTYPLRGKGVGAMPTLEEALRAFPDKRFLIQLKSDYPGDGKGLVNYLESRGLADWSRLSVFGAPVTVQEVQALRPKAAAWYDRRAAACTVKYLAVGWSGRVPGDCRSGVIMMPTNLRGLFWGWPNLFLRRMREADVQVLAIGEATRPGAAGFTRVDSLAQLERLPVGYDGAIWTDRIEVIGPALRKP